MSTPALVLTGLTKRFGAKLAVSRVSFSVQQGEIFGLIGPNGAGKTTTFSMMCGYLFPDEGQVRVLGVDPATPGALKGRLGALPQDAVLPPSWRVGPLLTFWAKLSGLPAAEAEARAALEAVGLAEAWSVQSQALSHGMAKRVSMAQALMGKPPLVLLDEPTAGLDPKVAAQVRELIRSMRRTQTVVVSSHNLQELEELCDAVAVLDRGELQQAGRMEELTGRGAEFRVDIARGSVPLEPLRLLTGVTEAVLGDNAALVVRFDPQLTSPEDVISRTAGLLLQNGVLFTSISRGRRLEDRVLQLL